MLVGVYHFPTDYGIDVSELARGLEERGLESLTHWPESHKKTIAEMDLHLTVITALEPLGNDLRIDSLCQKQCRARVTQIIQPERCWQSSAYEHRLEVTASEISVEERATLASRKHQIKIFPLDTCLAP